jgi:hypothetical protein
MVRANSGLRWTAAGAANLSTMIPRAKSKVFVGARAFSGKDGGASLRKRRQ